MTTHEDGDRRPSWLQPVPPPTYDDTPPPPDEPPPADEPPPTYADTRGPEHNLDAEQGVLAALLLNPAIAPDIATEITGADFYRPAHETIWDAAHRIANDPDQHLDILTLAGELQRLGELQRVGGAPYLHDLVSAPIIPANAAWYAAQVRDASRIRQVATVAARLQQLARTADPAAIDTTLAEALQTLDDAAMRFGPSSATNNTGLRDLAWLLGGQAPVVEPPQVCRRTDGHALFYPGRVNGVYGDPESGKTWLAQLGAVEALHNGQRAAIVDVDHNGVAITTERLLLLGAHPEQLADPDLFRYYEPDDAHELKAAIADVVTWQPAVVVLDSIGEMMPMLGIKSVDNDELTGALRAIASAPARVGACVITIDHLPKATEARTSGYAIGGTAKKRAIDGSYIYADARVPPAPGQRGKISLRIEKDRPGRLREVCVGKFAGTLTLDSTRPGITEATIAVETAVTADGIFRPTRIMEAVSRYVEANELSTGRQINAGVQGKGTHVAAAIDRLLAEGYLTQLDGPNRSKLHKVIALYREADDQHDTIAAPGETTTNTPPATLL